MLLKEKRENKTLNSISLLLRCQPNHNLLLTLNTSRLYMIFWYIILDWIAQATLQASLQLLHNYYVCCYFIYTKYKHVEKTESFNTPWDSTWITESMTARMIDDWDAWIKAPESIYQLKYTIPPQQKPCASILILKISLLKYTDTNNSFLNSCG